MPRQSNDEDLVTYTISKPTMIHTLKALPRILHPDEPAALVAWLCGPDSSGMTGAILPVDAGMTAR